MEANEYQIKAMRTIPDSFSKIDMETHALFGLSSEVGELHGIYQKIYQGHCGPTLDQMQKREVGDILWFIAEYCTAKGWAMGDVMKGNLEKLNARYPEGFDEERSLHREKGDF